MTLTLIIYDITENKIRTQIAKYLEQKGCKRIQKSVFVARLDKTQKEHIRQKIKELQYNFPTLWLETDSVLMFPFEADQLRQTEVFGNNPDFDEFLDPPSTYFF
jgi:CRISPR-associated protein Cas2